VFLEDAENNPKLFFEMHTSLLPSNSRPRFAKIIENLDRETTLFDFDAIDKIGFLTTLIVLHEEKMKKGRHEAAIVSLQSDDKNHSIDIDCHAYAPLKYKGEFYGFIPLKPFFPDLNMDENIFDRVLSMRVGRLIVQALLE